jgi:hypothetical protein
MITRRDRRGRRIGRNWFRELAVSTWREAHDAWLLQREAVCIGYATEEREYAQLHPRPTFKATLIGLAQTPIHERIAS